MIGRIATQFSPDDPEPSPASPQRDKGPEPDADRASSPLPLAVLERAFLDATVARERAWRAYVECPDAEARRFAREVNSMTRALENARLAYVVAVLG